MCDSGHSLWAQSWNVPPWRYEVGVYASSSSCKYTRGEAAVRVVQAIQHGKLSTCSCQLLSTYISLDE